MNLEEKLNRKTYTGFGSLSNHFHNSHSANHQRALKLIHGSRPCYMLTLLYTKIPSSMGNSRYEVCRRLADKQIPNVIRLEDLLVLHGSNTQVWDLHLLVEDPRSAAKIIDSMIEFWLNISSQDYLHRLGFALYIRCLTNYCYYLQDSEGEPVKSLTYAEKLKPEHREVHYNITSADPKEESFTTTSRHMYHVRRSREIKEGTFVPRPYKKGVFRAALTTVSEQ